MVDVFGDPLTLDDIDMPSPVARTDEDDDEDEEDDIEDEDDEDVDMGLSPTVPALSRPLTTRSRSRARGSGRQVLEGVVLVRPPASVAAPPPAKVKSKATPKKQAKGKGRAKEELPPLVSIPLHRSELESSTQAIDADDLEFVGRMAKDISRPVCFFVSLFFFVF
jgi:hypothetical protein